MMPAPLRWLIYRVGLCAVYVVWLCCKVLGELE